MRKRSMGFILFISAISLLVGCAGVQKQAFNKEVHQSIKTIGLLQPASAEKYFVQNLGHPGMSFGLVGGLIAAADMNEKTNQFDEMMRTRNFNVVNEFQEILTAQLQSAGYTVKVLKPEREKPVFLENYDALDKDVDAYLDVNLGAGYLCASSSADYIPTVRSHVRMVSRNSKEILYEDMIAYGYEMRALNAVSIAAQQQYFFKDFEALTGSPDNALEGLRKGVPLVVARITQDLAK